jgi:hypothetical protein
MADDENIPGGIDKEIIFPPQFVIPLSITHGHHATTKGVRCTQCNPDGDILNVEVLVPGAQMLIKLHDTTHITLEIEENP